MTGERITITSAVKGEVDLSAVNEAHPGYAIKYDGRQVELTPVLAESLAVREFRRARAIGKPALEKTTEIKED